MQVLFCTVPITSLFNIKYYAEPNLGGSEITGALKSEGVDVIHLDLNAALNEYRFKNENFSNQILEQEDFIDKNLSVYMYEGYLYKKMFSKVLNERTNNSITTRA